MVYLGTENFKTINQKIKNLVFNDKIDFEKLFLVFAINMFLYGDVDVEFDYYDYVSYDSSLFRKTKMLSHFRKNYKSLNLDDFNILYEDSVSTIWLKSNKNESIIMGLNNSVVDKQIVLDLSDMNPEYAFSLLDRSMITFEDGKTTINLSQYQVKLFNLKRN